MTELKVLPQKAYSLKDAIQYVESEYNVLLDERKLLNYIRTGDLSASIHIEGSKKGIEFLDFLDKKIEISLEDSLLSIEDTKGKLIKTGDNIYGTNIYDKYNMVNISFCTKNKEAHMTGTIYFKNLSFVRYLGYFKVPINTLFFNIDDVSDSSFLLPSFLDFVSNDKNIHIKLVAFPQNIKIGISNLCILHEDLINFLKLFPVIDTSYNNMDELRKEIDSLKSELAEKDTQITRLKQQLEENNFPIMLNEFMENDRLSLAIQARKEYWANYDPNLNNAPKADATAKEIQNKYNLSQKQASAIEIVACPINRNQLIL